MAAEDTVGFDDRYLGLLSFESAKMFARLARQTVTRRGLGTLAMEWCERRQKKHLDAVLAYLSDTIVFDTILGNDDRTSQKNSNVYMNKQETLPVRTFGSRKIVLQGKYHITVSDQCTIVLQSVHTDIETGVSDLCLYRRKTSEALNSLQGTLVGAFQTNSPSPIWKRIEERRLYWAETRLELVEIKFGKCVNRLGEHKVFHGTDHFLQRTRQSA